MSETKNEVGFVDNLFYDKDANYFMGIDTYDKNCSACCVMKQGGEVVYIGRSTNEKYFKKEVEMIAAFYHILPNNILKEFD
jgi:hypothetical protein